MRTHMLSRIGYYGVLAAAAVQGLAGCATEADGDVAEIVEAAPTPGPDSDKLVPQFASTGSFLWRDTTDSFADIGTAVNRTCFLSGVAGDLKPATSDTTSAGVRINGATNHYELFVNPKNGRELAAYARCVSTAAGLTAEMTWTDGQAAKNLGAVVAGRRCFLTQVGNSLPSGGTYGFKSNADNVQIWNDGVSWFLGGSQSGPASAKARCITVSEDHGWWLWIAGDPGTRKDELASAGTDTTCLLFGVGGQFTANDWSDGAFVSYDAGLLQFYMNTKNGHRGWSRCVE